VAADNGLRRTPVILYRNLAQRGQIVTALSPMAQLGSARVGMPLSEAKSLLQRSRHCGGVATVIEHDPDADGRALQQLAMDCGCFSPVVGLVQTREGLQAATQIEAESAGLWLDVGSVLHLFGGAASLQVSVGRHFEQRGYTIRQAIAPTPGKAWGLARFYESGISGGVPDDRLNEADFERLPLAALRLSPATIENLRQLGIERVEQIRQLPRRGLRSRFGDEVTRRLDQADGVMEEPITAIHPPADYEAGQTLEYPLSDRETILVVVSRLAKQLCDQMRSVQRGGLVWQLRLAAPGHPPLELLVKLFQPTATLECVLPLFGMQLEEVCSPPTGKRRRSLNFGVIDFCVSVRNCVLLAERQRELFDENPRRDFLVLAQLVNRLASRLGAEHVVRPRLRRGAMAEEAAVFEPLVGQANAGGNAAASAKPVRSRRRKSTRTERHRDTGILAENTSNLRSAISPMQRPLVLLPQPQEIAAVSVDGRPQTDINVPALFLVDGERLPVLRRWGPERIETAWWRGPVLRRDYWRIEVSDGRWLWVFRDLGNRNWFLHGKF
jgi:protein ImuB